MSTNCKKNSLDTAGTHLQRSGRTHADDPLIIYLRKTRPNEKENKGSIFNERYDEFESHVRGAPEIRRHTPVRIAGGFLSSGTLSISVST